MNMRYEPLFDFAADLGIAAGDLSSVESPTRLAGTFAVRGSSVAAAVTAEALDALGAEYGEAARFVFRIGDYDEFSYDGSYSIADLAAFVDGAAQTAAFDLVLEIDKAQLVARVLEHEPPCDTVLYFTADAAVAAFRAGIAAVEKALWSDTTRRLLILVLDQDVRLCGDALSIVGGTHLGAGAGEAARPPIDPHMANRVAHRRDDYIGWDTTFVSSLTPWHLFVDQTDDSALGPYVDAAFVLLAALFTCDRARSIVRANGSPLIRAEFHGREHVAFVPISDGAPLRDLSVEERTAIRGLLNWCYQTQTGEVDSPDWLADRLPFVQIRVAQALEGRPEERRFEAYARSMPEIYQGAKWHWRAFLEGRVSEYLDKVRDLEGTVANAVDQYAERTTALSKGLADAMLAAVAALIGSFIAGAFAKPFDARLFRIGLLAYAVYVAIFPGLLGLLSGNGQAAETKRSFEAQRTRFSQILYTDKVTEIVGDRVHNAERRYRRWVRGVACGYLVLAAAAVLGAFAIPHHVG